MTDALPTSMTCRSCLTASQVIRKLGFHDTITWGAIAGSPTPTLHATHANAGRWVERLESEQEYGRRIQVKLPHGQSHPPFGAVIREYPRQSLCNFYSSELAWMTVSRPLRLTVYMAHPVAEVRTPAGKLTGNSFADNVSDATCWLRYLRRVPVSTLADIVGAEFDQRPLILAPWLAAIEEDVSYPGGREAILQDSRDAAMMFNEVWMLGGRVSEGMQVEGLATGIVRDLTHLGPWSKFKPAQYSSKAVLKPRSR